MESFRNLLYSPRSVRSGGFVTPSEFGDLIRAARKRARLTQEQLAAASGVGPRFLIDLEAGKPTAQLGKALRVAEMAGLEIKLPARGVKTWL